MNNPENQSSSERAASVARRTVGLTVPDNPLNSVKLDLAIILIMGILLILVLWKIRPEQLLQGIVLSVYGFGAMFWLVFRTRRILKQWERNRQQEQDAKQD